MKFRVLLLASVAFFGVSTPAFSQGKPGDFGLGTCDALGISGLTLESDGNCLAISGGVDFEFVVGNYEPDGLIWAINQSPALADSVTFDDWTGLTRSESAVSWWLQFVATAGSDFGPAKAWIKLVGGEVISATPSGTPESPGLTIDGVEVDEAAVSIGSETLTLIFGKTASIFNDGTDEPLNYLGLALSEMVGDGVGFSTAAPTGGEVMQAVMAVGDGITVMAGLEDLQNGSVNNANGTFIGTLEVDQDWGAAHASVAYDDVFDPGTNIWNLHAGVTLEMEMATIIAALAADSNGYWNALISASADLDIFTLAGSAEFDSFGQNGFGGSIEAQVADGVTLALGGRLFDNTVNPASTQIGGRIIIELSENVTATGELGIMDGGDASDLGYASGELAFDGGGGFTASIAAEGNAFGAYKVISKASKEFD
jgi:porin-like protein